MKAEWVKNHSELSVGTCLLDHFSVLLNQLLLTNYIEPINTTIQETPWEHSPAHKNT